MKIIVDTNEIISAIIKDGLTRKIIIDMRFELFTPAYTLTEIKRHKEDILNKSGLTNKEFFFFIKKIFKYITIIDPALYDSYLNNADNIIGHIHKNDIPFIAAALAFDCPIWSNDKHFKQQNKVLIYTTKELINISP
jgi:predicted nucleic acid-binding protein